VIFQCCICGRSCCILRRLDIEWLLSILNLDCLAPVDNSASATVFKLFAYVLKLLVLRFGVRQSLAYLLGPACRRLHAVQLMELLLEIFD
jgi:hypothetical protein